MSNGHPSLHASYIVLQVGRRFVFRCPYSPAVLAAIHQLPGRRWCSDTRTWSVPATSRIVEPLRAYAAAYGFDISAVEAKLAHLERLRLKKPATMRESWPTFRFSLEDEGRVMRRFAARQRRDFWRCRRG
jgi:hypothetical protein